MKPCASWPQAPSRCEITQPSWRAARRQGAASLSQKLKNWGHVRRIFIDKAEFSLKSPAAVGSSHAHTPSNNHEWLSPSPAPGRRETLMPICGLLPSKPTRLLAWQKVDRGLWVTDRCWLPEPHLARHLPYVKGTMLGTQLNLNPTARPGVSLPRSKTWLDNSVAGRAQARHLASLSLAVFSVKWQW